MPKIRKHKHISKTRKLKRINKSIIKSSIYKKHVKVNINTGSKPSGLSYMQMPAYHNFSDIKTSFLEFLPSLHWLYCIFLLWYILFFPNTTDPKFSQQHEIYFNCCYFLSCNIFELLLSRSPASFTL